MKKNKIISFLTLSSLPIVSLTTACSSSIKEDHKNENNTNSNNESNVGNNNEIPATTIGPSIESIPATTIGPSIETNPNNESNSDTNSNTNSSNQNGSENEGPRPEIENNIFSLPTVNRANNIRVNGNSTYIVRIVNSGNYHIGDSVNTKQYESDMFLYEVDQRIGDVKINDSDVIRFINSFENNINFGVGSYLRYEYKNGIKTYAHYEKPVIAFLASGYFASLGGASGAEISFNTEVAPNSQVGIWEFLEASLFVSAHEFGHQDTIMSMSILSDLLGNDWIADEFIDSMKSDPKLSLFTRYFDNIPDDAIIGVQDIEIDSPKYTDSMTPWGQLDLTPWYKAFGSEDDNLASQIYHYIFNPFEFITRVQNLFQSQYAHYSDLYPFNANPYLFTKAYYGGPPSYNLGALKYEFGTTPFEQDIVGNLYDVYKETVYGFDKLYLTGHAFAHVINNNDKFDEIRIRINWNNDNDVWNESNSTSMFANEKSLLDTIYGSDKLNTEQTISLKANEGLIIKPTQFRFNTDFQDNDYEEKYDGLFYWIEKNDISDVKTKAFINLIESSPSIINNFDIKNIGDYFNISIDSYRNGNFIKTLVNNI